MPETPLDSYLATVRPDAHETVCRLAAAVEAAEVDFDCKVTYRMLMYTLGARWREWVVAIGVSKAVVNLRFLHGDLLDDAAGVLRAGTSTLMTIDFMTAGDVDPSLVTAYVREAAARHPA